MGRNREDILDRLEYVVCCVGEFAMRHGLSNAAAYAYLRSFNGIDFLLDCYVAEHTLSIEGAVDDIQAVCLQRGGQNHRRILLILLLDRLPMTLLASKFAGLCKAILTWTI